MSVINKKLPKSKNLEHTLNDFFRILRKNTYVKQDIKIMLL